MKYKKGDCFIDKNNNCYSKVYRVRNIHKDGTYTLVENLTSLYYDRVTENDLENYFDRRTNEYL